MFVNSDDSSLVFRMATSFVLSSCLDPFSGFVRFLTGCVRTGYPSFFSFELDGYQIGAWLQLVKRCFSEWETDVSYNQIEQFLSA